MVICKKEDCVGCYACQNVCPKKAIVMSESENGIFPKINTSKCVECGLCNRVCNRVVNLNETLECYSAFSKDDKVHIESSSGGIAYEFYRYFIKNKGIVYGVSSYLDSDGDISFIRVDNINDLYKLQGSKYTHAYIKNSYSNILEDLKNDLRVLFIGTPCQVAGLKKTLNKEYDKLLTVDLVCHGVVSQRFLKQEIKEEFDYINFRGRNGYSLIAKKNGKTVYKKNRYESDYFDLFLKGYLYRENCYKCKYAQKKRIGDLTIGDFWGRKDYKKKNGISMILVNTYKGQQFLSDLNTIIIEKERIESAYINNGQLLYPPVKNVDNSLLIKNIKEYGLKKAKIKMGRKDYYFTKLKGFLKKIKDLIKL